MKRLAIGMIFVSLAATAWCQTTVNRKYKETGLGPLPKESLDSLAISPDARHVAYLVKSTGGMYAVFDGVPQKTYAKVDALTFSPDSKWLAYVAQQGETWLVVVNGREETAYRRVGPPVFSPDSKRLAYVAQLPDQSRVVVINRQAGKPYDRIFEGQIVFSGDGRRVAYGALTGDQWHVVLDGQEGAPAAFFGSATGIVLSHDGARLAYAVKADKGDEGWSMFVDGRQQPVFEDTGEAVFSPDGKRFAYAACKNGKWRVVVDGAEQKAFDAVAEGSLKFSPDGKNLAYAAAVGEKWTIVANGREGRLYDAVSHLTFSANGKYLAAIARIGVTETVVVNGRESRLWDRIGGGTVVFNKHASRIAYVAHSGRGTFVVTGPVEPPKKDAKEKPAGKDAESDLGAKRLRRFDRVGYLTFNPDGDKCVYAATSGKQVFSVVDDLEAAHRYDAIWSPHGQKLVFDNYKKFHYLGVKKDQVFLVEEETE